MGLLKLVIVDDEPILLEGLVKTYDWNGMGYEVVGFAQSGEQALKVIREKKPHVVLTDIRMKQISGLMVMEEIKKENPECQFVVLSAYRDFEYAKKACDLGAFAYLLKPIEDEKLQATMTDVGKICEDQIRNEEKYDRWERLLKKDGDGFLQVVVQKYVQNRLPEEKVDERIRELGRQISRDYAGKQVHLICVLKGGVFFMCELAKRITVPVSMDFMCVGSYGDGTASSGVVRIAKDLDESIENKEVLIVEDIIDSGNTLYYLIDVLKKRNPASMKLCTLLDKPDRRIKDVKVMHTVR